jgi:hypothetical protein
MFSRKMVHRRCELQVLDFVNKIIRQPSGDDLFELSGPGVPVLLLNLRTASRPLDYRGEAGL